MKGLVLQGSRNVFTVRPETDSGEGEGNAPLPAELECRLKGKVLKGMEDYYNPLAPGDRVTVEADPLRPGTGLITAAEERRSILTRFNRKGQKSQILAANVDLALCITSPLSPPFRPRFLDRLLIQAERGGIEPVVVCNKCDLSTEGEGDTEERLADYERTGYRVLRVSAQTGAGMETLRLLLAGKTSVLLGQSGVGKTSLINVLAPALRRKTGTINEKYNRGNHTTTLSVMLELFFEGEGEPPPPLRGTADPLSAPQRPTYLIDTPGIRQMMLDGVTAEDLPLYMKEFAGLAGSCTYGLSCSHRSEAGCKILEAAAAGRIHRDRYESFVRIGDELAGR
jgi:ribosome biogenesis GTPase